MNYYPLLEIPGFGAEVQLANFPPTSDYREEITAARVYAAQTTGKSWKLTDCGIIAAGATGRYTRQSLAGNDLPQESIFFFMSKNTLPTNLPQLPPPSAFQSTEPAWRGNLRVIGNGAASGYTGDYPDHLASLHDSTLLSLSPMLQLSPGITNVILVVNMTLNPSVRNGHVKLIRLSDRRVLATYPVRTNSVNPINIDSSLISPTDSIALTCDSMTGIPIYVASNADKTMLSLEHTHPPAELTVFGPGKVRGGIVKKAKNYFLAATEN